MILTATLNPNVDKTLFLLEHAPGTRLSAGSVKQIAGGTALNVWWVVQILGEETLAMLVLGPGTPAP